MMTAGVAVGLVGRLTIVVLQLICGMVMSLYCDVMMTLMATVCGSLCGRGIGAARRRRKCSQSLHRQGQQQQPDGNQSQVLHGLQFMSF